MKTLKKSASRKLTLDLLDAERCRPYLERGRCYIDYSNFALEIFYKSCLKSFSEDLSSPSRLLLEDIQAEFRLRGTLPPVDASTTGYIERLRRAAAEMTGGGRNAA